MSDTMSISSVSLSDFDRLSDREDVCMDDVSDRDPRCKILVINDDGIESDGLHALALQMNFLGDVCVVAPEKSCTFPSFSTSTTGTFEERIDMEWNKDNKIRSWQVNTERVMDCLNIALYHILPTELAWSKPDLVVTGINRGRNVGTDLLYSGTVAAACGGSFDGIPSIAFSLAPPSLSDSQGEFAEEPFSFESYLPDAEFAKHLCYSVLKNGLPRGITLNVNVPNERTKRFAVTRASERSEQTIATAYQDPSSHNQNRLNFCIELDAPRENSLPGTDLTALNDDGCISVTPICLRRTLSSSESAARKLAEVGIPAYRYAEECSWPGLDYDSLSSVDQAQAARRGGFRDAVHRRRRGQKATRALFYAAVAAALCGGLAVGYATGRRHGMKRRSGS
eukprot:930537_1